MPFLMLIIASLLMIGSDAYIYRCLLRRMKSRWTVCIYIVLTAILYLLFATIFFIPIKSGSNSALISVMWILFTLISVYIPKILFVFFDILSRLPRLIHRSSWRPLSIAGVLIAAVTFVALWWGALINRFNIEVKEVDIEVDALPSSFDGFTIAQFSDLHVGTFNGDTAFVNKLVDKINSLSPDIIVFTGDVVNRRSEEMLSYVDVLSRLKAPHGVFSILGNHDYGDYSYWENELAKEDNLRLIKELECKAGFRLLLNESEIIKFESDSIAIVGVENIGDPPFKSYGSLSDAYPCISDSTVKVLLSHNPAHWSSEIADRDSVNVALTLSGHTHAMQMELLGLSPASFRYKTWGGLYEDSLQKHKLYVNIGAGTVGFPMRLGATPEITMLKLVRKK